MDHQYELAGKGENTHVAIYALLEGQYPLCTFNISVMDPDEAVRNKKVFN